MTVILTFLVALYDELYGQYNWASLGKVMLGLIKKCKMSQGESIGGACKIDHYLSYHFHNVGISIGLFEV